MSANHKFEHEFPAIDKVLNILERRYNISGRQMQIPYDIGNHEVYKGIAMKTIKKCEKVFPEKKIKKDHRSDDSSS